MNSAGVLPGLIGPTMLDTVFIAAGVAFFAASVGYIVLCDRL
ncbi:hypothetical protein [Methylobacterium sp. ID0610]